MRPCRRNQNKMQPIARKPTRQNRCTIEDVWHCFFNGERAGDFSFKEVEVIDAHSKLGVNKPRFMIKDGLLIKTSIKNIEYYVLTPWGMVYLISKYANFIARQEKKK